LLSDYGEEEGMASIRKHPKTRKPQVMYRDPSGRQHGPTFDRVTDARKFKAAVETDLERGQWIDPRLGKVRVATWGPDWLDAQGHLKPKTREGYWSLWRSQIEPYWANHSLASIKPLDVQAWRNEMSRRGLSDSRIRQSDGLFSMMMTAAADNGYIARSPVGKLKLRKDSTKERPLLAATLDEVARTAAAADRYGYRVLVWFAAASGGRFGELRALKRSRCHLKADVPFVEVVESVTDVKGRPYWGDPKSHQARVVYLPSSVAELLDTYLEARVASDSDALVFTSPKGHLIDPNNFRNKVWLRVVEDAELDPRFRFHDLRHSCGSLLAGGGVPLHEVKQHLGHSSVVVTEKYVHFYPRGTRAVATSLFDFLKHDVFRPFIEGQRTRDVDPGLTPAASELLEHHPELT